MSALIDDEALDDSIQKNGENEASEQVNRERIDEALVDVLTAEDIQFLNDAEQIECSPTFYRRAEDHLQSSPSKSTEQIPFNDPSAGVTEPTTTQQPSNDDEILWIPKPTKEKQAQVKGPKKNFNDALYIYHFKQFSSASSKEAFKKEIEKKFQKPIPPFLDYLMEMQKNFLSTLPKFEPVYSYESPEQPSDQETTHPTPIMEAISPSPKHVESPSPSAQHAQEPSITKKQAHPPLPDFSSILHNMSGVSSENEIAEFKLFFILRAWNIKRAPFLTTRIIEMFRTKIKSWIEQPDRLHDVVTKQLKVLKIRTSKRTRGRRGGRNRPNKKLKTKK